MSSNARKKIHLGDQIEEKLTFETEHSRYDVGTLLRRLIGQKCVGDLGPVWITCKCNKEVGGAASAHVRHGVLSPFGHISRPAGEGRRKHDQAADVVSCEAGVLGHRIAQQAILLGAQLLLVEANESEALVLDLDVHVDDVLLPQAPAAE